MMWHHELHAYISCWNFLYRRVHKVVPADLGSGQGSRFDCINNELFNWHLKYEDTHLYTSIAAQTKCLTNRIVRLDVTFKCIKML